MSGSSSRFVFSLRSGALVLVQMIEIDGSVGEGGGQILRTSLALAAVMKREIRVFNIRAGREEPGLRAQHLTGVRALAQICNADSRGVQIGSTEFTFSPTGLRTGVFRFDVGTAGSITLVLQSLLPVLPFASSELEVDITGGTDVKWSPPIDYLRLVALPLLARMRVNVSIRKFVRGHYPRGGGLVSVRSTPTGMLTSLTGRERGEVVKIGGTSHVSNLPKHIAERQAESAANEITNAKLPRPEISIDTGSENRNQSAGSGIVLVARSDTEALLGADCLGERGKPAEEVGRLAGRQLVEEISSGKFLDKHMGDIIVPYMALAQGISDVSISRMTQHTITNVRVAEAVAGVRFDPLTPLDMPGRLRVNGIGWKQA